MTNEFDKETQKTIDNIYEQIEVLKGKVDELKSGPKNKNIRWRADGKNRFFYLNFNSGSIIESEDSGWANLNYQTGNYFKTKEGAEQYKSHLIITQKIKDIALRLNNGVEIDWFDNEYQKKYCIYYMFLELHEELIQEVVFNIKYVGGIYCLSDKFLETCVKEIGEKELIEYIKGR